MPTIGSVSGTFGHGRSPQNAPQPGFTIFPPIGRTSTWNFAANGAFEFEANTVASMTLSSPQAGNCFVITPTTTFIANIAAWGAGGTSTRPSTVSSQTNIAGAGGAVQGTFKFEGGQPYTVFVSGSGVEYVSGGSGGGSSGIFEGNIFQLAAAPAGGIDDSTTAVDNPYVAMASGGGGAAQQTFRLAGAGGDKYFPQYGTVTAASQSILQGSSGQSGYLVAQPGQSGLPGRYNDWFTGGRQTTGWLAGGGSRRGATESGGLGHVRTAATDETGLEAVGGNYSIAALYDHNRRGTAGDSDHGGRMSIYLDQYQVANIVATGGTVTDVPIPGHELAYRYHTFDTSSTFVVNSAAVTDTVDIFAVGGGGGGTGASGGTVGSIPGAGGGGGGVALRIGYSITPGTYNVDVGTGGAKSDQYAVPGTGRIHGGYRGRDSAFYTNPLTTRAFPDSYWRLLNSFGTPFRYISLSGDDTNGQTPATAYTSFSSALTKNASNNELMVFAVIGGTYTAEMPPNAVQSPIIDNGKPRVFVCAPGKVIINFTPAQAQSPRSSPMAALSNSLSAVYGAIFVRTMFESTSIEETAFFNNNTTPSAYRTAGSFYNCVFRENSNFWSFGYGPYINNPTRLQFRIENCTFFTKNASQTTPTDATRVLVRNSVFNRPVTTDAVLDNTVTNQAVTTKYVATGITDKGVFSGPYSWDGAITVPAKTARNVMIMAQGGGGAVYPQEYLTPDQIGGSGGGIMPGTVWFQSFSTQYNRLLNPDYSSYGFPCLRGGGGGGAAYPGDSVTGSPRGGLGIEWPRDSGVYYGTGGDSTAESIVQVAPGTVGKGGNGTNQFDSSAQPTNGHDGIVAVRYVVPGPYTPPSLPRTNVNLIAYGGIVTSTATYRQHVFTSSDRFVMLNRPEQMTLEVLAVGGGGGGAGIYYSSDQAFGGRGGNQTYNTISLQLPSSQSSNTLAVVVGAGGGGGSGWWYEDRSGRPGADSAVIGAYNINIRGTGGAGGSTVSNFAIRPGTVVTVGLFSDNTQAYGADAGYEGRGWPYYYPSAPNPANWGNYGSGGRSFSQSGVSGIVIIRYPIYPTN